MLPYCSFVQFSRLDMNKIQIFLIFCEKFLLVDLMAKIRKATSEEREEGRREIE